MNTLQETKSTYKKITPEEWVIRKAKTKRRQYAKVIAREYEKKRNKILENDKLLEEIIGKVKYKVIPENPNYYCTEDGRVWSRLMGNFLAMSDHVLGYKFVGKFKINGKKKLCLIHQVVAHTFIPNPNNFKELNHLDGNKHNNHVNNLEWTTREENIRHAWRIGLMENVRETSRKNLRGKCFNAKLDENAVREIRKLHKEGTTVQELLGMYEIKETALYMLINNKSWKWVN